MGRRTMACCLCVLICMLVASLVCGCSRQSESDDRVHVVVSILPQVDFVRRIGGDHVSVVALVPPGASPETFEPGPESLQALEDADVYVRIGHLPFEEARMPALVSINPDMMVIDSSQGIILRRMEGHHHDADVGHDHEESGDDPHIWLSPDLVKVQAQNIYEALCDADPAHRMYFSANLDVFLEELDDVDAELEHVLSRVKTKKLLVFHPAWGYFADHYGFEQIPIEIEGKEPSAGDLAMVIDAAKADGIGVVFVQEQFRSDTAASIAQEIDGRVVYIDPLAEDCLGNMRIIAETIAAELG